MRGNILLDFLLQARMTIDTYFPGSEGASFHISEPDSDLPIHFISMRLGDAWIDQLNMGISWYVSILIALCVLHKRSVGWLTQEYSRCSFLTMHVCTKAWR